SAPHWPCLRNANGEGRTLSLILKTVVGGLNGSDWPLSFCRRGLGSKVSIWDGPPSMNWKMTDFALGAKCGALGASGFTVFRARRPAKASPPKPLAQRNSISRRLLYIDKLRGIE